MPLSSPGGQPMAIRTRAAEGVPLRERDCRASGCLLVFYLCRRCDRGQRYCGPACRARARIQQFRAANARHQRSEAGCEDHRERQQRYRQRKRAKEHSTKCLADPVVTYQSSHSPDSGSCCQSDSSPDCPPQSKAQLPRPRCRVLPPLRCLRCRRPGYLSDSILRCRPFRF